jgi:hypothetical protein
MLPSRSLREREERERRQQFEQAKIERLLDEAASLRRANDFRASVSTSSFSW